MDLLVILTRDVRVDVLQHVRISKTTPSNSGLHPSDSIGIVVLSRPVRGGAAPAAELCGNQVGCRPAPYERHSI